MIEANATYLLQKLSSVDAQGSRASGLVSSTNNILADIGVFMPVATLFSCSNISSFISLV